jgi:magnesium transporter
LKEINNQKEKAELVHYYFVTNNKGKLMGAVALEDIVFSSPTKKLKDILHTVSSVTTNSDHEESAREFSDHDYSVLPVVNTGGFLVGMITSDDVLDVITEEATEDMQKMAGINSVDTPYLKTSV